jgi:uncharacterized protein (DUF2336 family)
MHLPQNYSKTEQMPWGSRAMESSAIRLNRLVDLAKETSSDKRRELLREVTEVFLDNGHDCSEAEKSYFGEIIGKVSTGMDVAFRKNLAARLADNPNAPHALIQGFAMDQDEIAHEVLTRSPVLRDQDLISVTQGGNQQKIGAIARRSSIPEAVSEAIVEHGDDTVVSELVSNAGAKVSRGTFRKVIERAETSAVLQAPLVNREDLPADMVNELFAFVKAELRKQVQQRIEAIPPEELDRALKEAEREVMSDLRQMRATDRKAMVFVGEMFQQRKLNEGLLIQLVKTGKTAELIHAFARIAEIDVRTMKRLFNARNIEGIAIICRSLRFERSTFSTIAVAILPSEGEGSLSIHQILDLYNEVTAETAQRVIRFWRVRREVSDQPDSA